VGRRIGESTRRIKMVVSKKGLQLFGRLPKVVDSGSGKGAPRKRIKKVAPGKSRKGR